MTGFSNSVQAKGHFGSTMVMDQQMQDQKLREQESVVQSNVKSPRNL